MKTLFVILFIAFISINSKAQNLKEQDVPAAVKTNFVSLYPNISNPKWETENGKYEAEFKENNTETSVVFDSNGTLIQTEIEISVSALPAKVQDYASSFHPGKLISEGTKIIDSKGRINYEAEIGGHDYIFDEDGNFIRDDDPDIKDTDDDN